jgi:hypothetical protein
MGRSKSCFLDFINTEEPSLPGRPPLPLLTRKSAFVCSLKVTSFLIP